MTPNGQGGVDIWSLSDLETPWALRVVVTLRIAEHLAAGIDEIERLAAASGCDPAFLHRVVRHLTGRGVFDETAPGRFALNDAARVLLDPAVRLGLDLNGIGGRMAQVWAGLLDAVRTGAPAYHTVFGRPFWEDLEAHPVVGESFDALMGPMGHGTPDPDVLIDGDWDSVHTVVDVGGGTGAFLAEVLRAHPLIRGTLVDLPSTVARAASTVQAAAVADRVTTVGQSFFDPLPPGADLYFLKNVLADWPDREAAALLTRCADAARPSGRIVIVGGVFPDYRGGPPPELLMMVLIGGKGRSLTEFDALAQTAGLRVKRAGRVRSKRFVVECRPK